MIVAVIVPNFRSELPFVQWKINQDRCIQNVIQLDFISVKNWMFDMDTWNGFAIRGSF
jgi:hypothetical protein